MAENKEKTLGQQLKDELLYKTKNAFNELTDEDVAAAYDYAEGYKTFLDEGKTEREVCSYVVAEAEKQGYKPFAFGMKLNVGDKVYYNNRGKNLYLIRIGKKDVAKNGIRIIASHIDSPRIDLKQVPLQSQLVFSHHQIKQNPSIFLYELLKNLQVILLVF